jgi:hypothetical protein
MRFATGYFFGTAVAFHKKQALLCSAMQEV